MQQNSFKQVLNSQGSLLGCGKSVFLQHLRSSKTLLDGSQWFFCHGWSPHELLPLHWHAHIMPATECRTWTVLRGLRGRPTRKTAPHFQWWPCCDMIPPNGLSLRSGQSAFLCKKQKKSICCVHYHAYVKISLWFHWKNVRDCLERINNKHVDLIFLTLFVELKLEKTS